MEDQKDSLQKRGSVRNIAEMFEKKAQEVEEKRKRSLTQGKFVSSKTELTLPDKEEKETLKLDDFNKEDNSIRMKKTNKIDDNQLTTKKESIEKLHDNEKKDQYNCKNENTEVKNPTEANQDPCDCEDFSNKNDQSESNLAVSETFSKEITGNDQYEPGKISATGTIKQGLLISYPTYVLFVIFYPPIFYSLHYYIIKKNIVLI